MEIALGIDGACGSFVYPGGVKIVACSRIVSHVVRQRK